MKVDAGCWIPDTAPRYHHPRLYLPSDHSVWSLAPLDESIHRFPYHVLALRCNDGDLIRAYLIPTTTLYPIPAQPRSLRHPETWTAQRRARQRYHFPNHFLTTDTNTNSPPDNPLFNQAPIHSPQRPPLKPIILRPRSLVRYRLCAQTTTLHALNSGVSGLSSAKSEMRRDETGLSEMHSGGEGM